MRFAYAQPEPLYGALTEARSSAAYALVAARARPCERLESMVHPCSACGRHVRSNESRCPFCHAPFEAHAVESPTPESMRLSRTALLVATSLSLAGCPFAARYGGPPISASAPADPPVAAAPTTAPSNAADAQVASPKR